MTGTAQLEPSRRDHLVERLLRTLQSAVKGSRAEPLGSLRSGAADAYSDIDIRWHVPDERFDWVVARPRVWLDSVQPVASLRADPDFARSAKRRLIYVRFVDVPLFWRLDLDVMALSIGGDDSFDRDNAAARDTHTWSLHKSALMNAIAALKALHRGNRSLAAELLGRGASRAGVALNVQPTFEGVAVLAAAIAAADEKVSALAEEIRVLAESAAEV